MDHIGSFSVRKFPSTRNPTLDTLEIGLKKHHIPILFDHDVTDGAPAARRLGLFDDWKSYWLRDMG